MKQRVDRLAGNFSFEARMRWRAKAVGRRQQGSIAILTVGAVLIIIGFFGLALDFAKILNRKAEMQSVADNIAISAAGKLNGTQQGVIDAIAAAHSVVEADVEWMKPKYEYHNTMVLSEEAIRFGRLTNGTMEWLDANTAKTAPDGLMYARVDTGKLNSAYGTVDMLFMPVLSSALASVTVGHVAIAGRRRINVTPLAICAMSPTDNAKRANVAGYEELVEYGFRRGVSYNLMKLNSTTETTPANFLVDPIGLADSSSPTHFDVTTVGPYVCTGTMAVANVNGTRVRVQSGFPIGQLYDHLNSRFDQSNGKCDVYSAPPDSNIRQYTPAALTWMSKPTGYQTADTYADAVGKKLETVADPDPSNTGATRYGPLWAFARAVPWTSYTAGSYTPFPASQTVWNNLYPTAPTLGTYPSPAGTATPYDSAIQSPTGKPGVKYRRVLNVPLLECPVSGSQAKVLAIGKFFMTALADSVSISAEFAGTVTNQPVSGPVELY